MSENLINDSTKTFKPIIYQFLVALEKCFQMQYGESIWIEKYGDVTSSSGVQIEVKDHQKNLTDLDHNVWKTLKNWLDDNFDATKYKNLILLTTQTISKSSKFIDWNTKNKDEKYQILNLIAKEFNKQKEKSDLTQKLLNDVLNSNKSNKLLEILDKFTIQSKADNDEILYKKIKETRTDGILEEKKDEYLDSLIGYIINPAMTSSGWEIKNKEFRQKTKSLIETYTSTTKIFPKIETPSITDDIIKEHQSYLFVQKIEDIDYFEVKSEAISDFIYSRTILNEELKNYEISRKEYKHYEDELLKSFQAKRRNALLNVNSSNRINKSKKLYNDTIGEAASNFYNFNDTPKSYRNGILHELANDSDNPSNIVWKLEVSDE
ncbi:hypothetical protein [uncultured Campylobacter sp.]|jgi:hypothetical protein B2_02757|uniref:hypothetical protein n=1 Tax=uncultured Campylobacter sp. TaxID=218934 RepID=UPI002605E2E0|nr:hypothetical protein [uncultured Campylobacter sp.]